MKALSNRTMMQKVRRETQKYLTEEYDKLAYEAVIAQAPVLMRQTEAILLFALSKHGYGEKRLNEIHGWFVSLTKMPDIFGKTPKASDAMMLMHDKFGINFDEVSPRMETWEEYYGDAQR